MSLPFCMFLLPCQRNLNPENDTSLNFDVIIILDQLSLLCCRMQNAVRSDSSQQVLQSAKSIGTLSTASCRVETTSWFEMAKNKTFETFIKTIGKIWLILRKNYKRSFIFCASQVLKKLIFLYARFCIFQWMDSYCCKDLTEKLR